MTDVYDKQFSSPLRPLEHTDILLKKNMELLMINANFQYKNVNYIVAVRFVRLGNRIRYYRPSTGH
jgi:hypothetical protein